jgi:uridine kinase
MKPFTIGITGGSGSGKTSFIRELKENFAPEQVCIISQDNYYRPREEQFVDERGWCNFDLPTAIDRESFQKDVSLLIKGQQVKRKEYVYNNEIEDDRYLVYQPAPILIVEGIFVLHFSEIRQMLDLRVYLHAKDNLKVIRRIRRDQLERNYDLEEILYRYEHHVLPTFERYIRPYMEDSDIIINNSGQYQNALLVMGGFLKNYIAEKNK